MKTFDQLDGIIDEAILPTGEDSVFILKDRSGKVIADKELKHPDVLYLGRAISNKVFSNTRRERYDTISTQTVLDSMNSDKELKRIAGNLYIWCKELVLKSGYVVPEPRPVFYQGNTYYSDLFEDKKGQLQPQIRGGFIKADVDTKHIVDTLVKAGVMKRPEQEHNEHYLPFPNIGALGIRTSWNTNLDLFDVVLSHPYHHDGIAVFEKITSQKAKVEKAC